MRYYKVNKVEHTVFDSEDELPRGLDCLQDWRAASIGDWVKADDDCYIQILREGKMFQPKGKIKERRYLGTCTGTFIVADKTLMDTSKRVNIYSFGGDIGRNERLHDREKLSNKEELFVQLVSRGEDPMKAYLKAFPTNNPHYANYRAGQLIKTTRIKTAMKEELIPYMEELGIDETYILRNIKGVIDSEDSKEESKLKALFKLSDIMDMEDKSKTQTTQLTGAVFQGFSKDALQEAERPKEISNGR